MTNIRRFYMYRLLAFVAYLVPMATLFGIRHNIYLKTMSSGLSFFGFVVVMLLAISFKSKLTAVARKNTVMTISVVIFVVAVVMQYLATELLIISLASVVGCVFSAIFEPVAEVYKGRCYKDGAKVRTERLPHKKAWQQGYLGIDDDTHQ